jgi:hypothetical protein
MSHGRAVFFDRFSRQLNTSAALLNVAMFNTIHDDADLRSAAYRLLQAVCLSLNYEGDLFLPSTGLSHPCYERISLIHVCRRLHLRSPDDLRCPPQ